MFKQSEWETQPGGDFRFGKLISWVLSAIVILTLVFGTVGTVSAGFVGVKTRFSAVQGTVQPGLYFKMPFVEHVIEMDTQTQKEQVDATAASSDLQNVTATVAVNFHVLPADASTIYQNIGADYQARVIDPAIQEAIKSITANYTAEQLITSREKVREEILVLLTTKFEAYGIKTDSLNIVNFNFSESFNTAIEAKVTAQQNALAAENKLAQVKFEAQQTVATAQASAEAIKIQAAAINSQGGADYVALQAIKQWDGHYPQTVVGGGSIPLISLK
jgi:regulator of protease activity HflC (stomatin/prohibitin superfamily)